MLSWAITLFLENAAKDFCTSIRNKYISYNVHQETGYPCSKIKLNSSKNQHVTEIREFTEKRYEVSGYNIPMYTFLNKKLMFSPEQEIYNNILNNSSVIPSIYILCGGLPYIWSTKNIMNRLTKTEHCNRNWQYCNSFSFENIYWRSTDIVLAQFIETLLINFFTFVKIPLDNKKLTFWGENLTPDVAEKYIDIFEMVLTIIFHDPGFEEVLKKSEIVVSIEKGLISDNGFWFISKETIIDIGNSYFQEFNKKNFWKKWANPVVVIPAPIFNFETNISDINTKKEELVELKNIEDVVQPITQPIIQPILEEPILVETKTEPTNLFTFSRDWTYVEVETIEWSKFKKIKKNSLFKSKHSLTYLKTNFSDLWKIHSVLNQRDTFYFDKDIKLTHNRLWNLLWISSWWKDKYFPKTWSTDPVDLPNTINWNIDKKIIPSTPPLIQEPINTNTINNGICQIPAKLKGKNVLLNFNHNWTLRDFWIKWWEKFKTSKDLSFFNSKFWEWIVKQSDKDEFYFTKDININTASFLTTILGLTIWSTAGCILPDWKIFLLYWKKPINISDYISVIETNKVTQSNSIKRVDKYWLIWQRINQSSFNINWGKYWVDLKCSVKWDKIRIHSGSSILWDFNFKHWEYKHLQKYISDNSIKDWGLHKLLDNIDVKKTEFFLVTTGYWKITKTQKEILNDYISK